MRVLFHVLRYLNHRQGEMSPKLPLQFCFVLSWFLLQDFGNDIQKVFAFKDLCFPKISFSETDCVENVK